MPLASPASSRGLEHAHRTFGKLPWRDLVEPAVTLARDGVVLDSFHASEMAGVTRLMADYAGKVPDTNAALREGMTATLGTFRKADGTTYATGETWRQPDLAATLAAIAAGGADAFYRGPLARTMATRVTAMGGIWTEADLAAYKAVEREPIRFVYHGHDVITMPPPSGGGITMRQILAASDALHLERLDWDSVDRIHLYVEALRRIFADSTQLLGDPGFVTIPLTTILDTGYIPKRMADIDRAKATPSSAIKAGAVAPEHLETTHFSVVDGAGMAVASTFTLNGGFGAKLQVPGTGVTAQQRDGRLHRQAGVAEHVRPGDGGAERDRSRASGC